MKKKKTIRKSKKTKKSTSLKCAKKSPKGLSQTFRDKVEALAKKIYRVYYAPYYKDQDQAWNDAWYFAYGRLTYKRGVTAR